MIFNLLELPWDWLCLDPNHWELDQSFITLRDYIRTVKVTNDVAERGVKLIADYATILTQDDHMRELLLHGVERNRQMYPNFKKSVLNG